MQFVINAAYFREKVQICLKLAKALSWDDPVRYQLLLIAEDFQKREMELESSIGSKMRVRN
jgi:hypothetical protein